MLALGHMGACQICQAAGTSRGERTRRLVATTLWDDSRCRLNKCDGCQRFNLGKAGGSR